MTDSVDSGSSEVEFRILGPIEAWVNGCKRPLGGARQERLLAMLLLNANETVTGDTVIDALWDTEPPDTSRRQVHNAIAALRRGLGEARSKLITVPAGYRIEAGDDQIDAVAFGVAVEAARHQCAAGNLDRAVEEVEGALRLWRGTALNGLEGASFTGAAARLDEQRLLARQLLLDCRLDRGECAALIPELTQLVAVHPFQEGFHRRLMLALHQAGRQAEALGAYERARVLFQEELGLDPGPELRELHQRILRGDPGLTPRGPDPVAPPEPAGNGVRRESGATNES